MAGRQVTAIISQTGEPIRNLPWPLYYRPGHVQPNNNLYNYPHWGEPSQHGGSCDTTPATPESLLTDSPETPTEFYSKSDHHHPPGGYGKDCNYFSSRASPELISFSVSRLLHNDKLSQGRDYDPSLSPPGYVFGPNSPSRSSGSSRLRPPDNNKDGRRPPYHVVCGEGEISLFERLPLSVKTKENPISNSKDTLSFKVSGDRRTEICSSPGWPFLTTAVPTACNSSIEWSSCSSLKETPQSPSSAEIALLISSEDLTIQPTREDTAQDDIAIEDTSKPSSVSSSWPPTVRLEPGVLPEDPAEETVDSLSAAGPSELALSVCLSDCGRTLSESDRPPSACRIPGQSPNIYK